MVVKPCFLEWEEVALFESRVVLDGSQTAERYRALRSAFESRVVLDENCMFRNWQAYSYIL